MKKILEHIENLSSYSDTTIIRPYIIAEAGVNHEGDLKNAKLLIKQASDGGADAIKFQSYKAEKLASKQSPAYWDTNKEKTESQFKLFKKYDNFEFKDYEILKDHCDSHNIEFLSTPFDIDSATYLNDLMKVFKISSSDITNKPFIEFICKFNKPIILSTGAANITEIKNACEWIKKSGNKIVLLHCILNYPTENKNANLQMIKGLKNEFPGVPIGYSDHTLPQEMQILEAATLLGSTFIEKHFTLNKKLPGNDHYHAMDQNDLILLNKKLDNLFLILGDEDKRPLESENISRENARRSLVSNIKICKGQIITEDMITWKRPGTGIQPYELRQLIGKKAVVDILEDTLLDWSMFNES